MPPERDKETNNKDTVLGESIREARKAHGFTLRELADRAGISAAYISALEHNRNPKTGKPSTPSPDVMERLSQALPGIAGVPDDSISPSTFSLYADQARQSAQKAVILFELATKDSRNQAAGMVLRGEIDPFTSNLPFSHRLALASAYTSAAVAIHAALDNLKNQLEEIHSTHDTVQPVQ